MPIPMIALIENKPSPAQSSLAQCHGFRRRNRPRHPVPADALPAVLVLAAAVALSRVYLRVHFPLDVIAGGLIGAGLGALCGFAALRLVRSRVVTGAA